MAFLYLQDWSDEVSFSASQVNGMIASLKSAVETLKSRHKLDKEISARLELEARVNRKYKETNEIVKGVLHTSNVCKTRNWRKNSKVHQFEGNLDIMYYVNIKWKHYALPCRYHLNS